MRLVAFAGSLHRAEGGKGEDDAEHLSQHVPLVHRAQPLVAGVGGVVAVVRNGDGKVVFSDSGAEFPYIWNLTDASGAQVAEGRYEVEAYLHGGAAYGRSSVAEIVVSRD